MPGERRFLTYSAWAYCLSRKKGNLFDLFNKLCHTYYIRQNALEDKHSIKTSPEARKEATTNQLFGARKKNTMSDLTPLEGSVLDAAVDIRQQILDHHNNFGYDQNPTFTLASVRDGETVRSITVTFPDSKGLCANENVAAGSIRIRGLNVKATFNATRSDGFITMTFDFAHQAVAIPKPLSKKARKHAIRKAARTTSGTHAPVEEKITVRTPQGNGPWFVPLSDDEQMRIFHEMGFTEGR
jgi:hypothetical protein